MILLRLAVEDWKGLRGRVELGPLSPGLNLIHGPNETGKSTLLDALCRGFFDRHGSTGEEMKKRQTWGTNLGPRVEIDFEAGGGRYRLIKKFLTSPSCELSRWRDGAWEKFDEGKSADERIVELAAGESTGKGMTKPEHWGLGQVLWAQQGQAAELAVGDRQQLRLREALKLTIDGAQGEAVERAVFERYDESYSPGGKLRGGQQNMAAVLRLAEESAAADATVKEIEERMRAIEQASHDLANAEAENEATKAQSLVTQTELVQQRAKLAELTARQLAYAELETAQAKASERWESLNGQVHRIAAADAAILAAQAAADSSRLKGEQAAAARAGAESALNAAKAEQEARSAEVEACEKAQAGAERIVRWLEVRRQAEAAERQAEQARARAKAVADARNDLTSLAAPSAREIEALRKLHRQVGDKRAELAAASLRVRIEPAKPLNIATRVDEAESPAATLDRPLELSAVGAAELVIEGVGRIVIRAGASDAVALAAELAKLERTWREKTAAFIDAAPGTPGSPGNSGNPLPPADLAPLEALAARRAAAEQRLTTLEQQPASTPADVASLEQAVREARATQQALIAEEPALASGEFTPDGARADLASAKARVAAAKARLASAANFVKEQAKLHEAARNRAEEAGRDRAVHAAMLETKTNEAAALRQVDGQTDAQRREALHAALTALDQARQRLAAAERPPVESLRRDIELLEKQERAQNTSLQIQGNDLGRLRKTVDDAGGEGLYSRLAEATEKAEDLRARQREAELDAAAVKLLHETLQSRKRETLDALLLPVRLAVETQFGELVGPRYSRVEFDDRLAPSGVRPAGRDVEAPADALSFGTREQLMLLVRLALARLLGREGERQCVILDDPLVNADRARQRSALRILRQAGSDAQILVLTCDPSAYDGLEGAAKFDLAAIAKAARG
ncbi:MAG: AAA family ATPase [Planctomycetota bacterium]|nr:AAA family ATPase [Planctomycetota bacterium]